MTQDSFELNTVNDYKFLACVLGDKLRNTNFEADKRQTFIKTVLEQIVTKCSLRAYERIQKTIAEIGHQKDQDLKQLNAKMKEQSNRKQKTLVSLKDKNYKGRQLQDYQSQQQQDDYDQEQQEEDYSKFEK